MHPYYFDYLVQKNIRITDRFTIIKDNVSFYNTRITEEYANNPLNVFIYTALYAVIAQNDQTYMDTFYNALDDLFAKSTKGVWGFFNQGIEDNKYIYGNDVSLDAFFLTIIINCVCGVQIQGGYFPDRTTYKPLSFLCDLYARMPSTWKDVILRGLGKSARPFTIANIA